MNSQLLEEANNLRKSGRNDLADAIYNQLLLREPNNDEYIFCKAMNILKMDPKRAIVLFGKAVEINPKMKLAFETIASTAIENNLYDLAIPIFDKEIGLNPNNLYLVYQRAKLMSARGDYVQALIDFYHVVDNSKLNNNPNEFEKHQISKDIKAVKKHLRLETQNKNFQDPTSESFINRNRLFSQEHEYELPYRDLNNKNYYFNFGKFAGQTIKTVLGIEPSYLIWCISNLYGFCVSEEIMEILRNKGLNIDQIENLNFYYLSLSRQDKPMIEDNEGMTFEQFVINRKSIEDGYCITEELHCNEEKLIDLDGIEGYPTLRNIFARNNQLTEIIKLSALRNLQVLDLAHNRLNNLPDISSLCNLKELYVESNLLSQLPDLSSLSELEVLSVGNNQLSQLPDVSMLSNLKKLILEGNQLTKLPDLSGLKNLEVLHLSRNQLEIIPNIYHLTSLQELSCYGNRLTRIPDLSNCRQLRYLSCGSNLLSELPNLSSLKYLKSLNVCNNSLTKLPDLSKLVYLKHLNCEGNNLSILPDLTWKKRMIPTQGKRPYPFTFLHIQSRHCKNRLFFSQSIS